jgi:hypothetical protein
LLTKGGAIIIPLTSKGCIADINLLAPDGWISGKDNDLSAFGCDFKDFEHLKFGVEENHLKVTLNNELIFDRIQKYSLSEIIGIRINFEGVGEISEVKFSNPQKVVYEEKF